MGIVDEREEEVMQHFIEYVWFNESSGKYSVSLLWRKNAKILCDNYSQAHLCLQILLRRFQKGPKFYEEYNSFMQEQIEKEILENVLVELPKVSKSYYTPHLAVIREDQVTTKLGVVNYAS